MDCYLMCSASPLHCGGMGCLFGCCVQAVLDEVMEQLLFSGGTAWEAAPLPLGLRPVVMELVHALVATQARLCCCAVPCRGKSPRSSVVVQLVHALVARQARLCGAVLCCRNVALCCAVLWGEPRGSGQGRRKGGKGRCEGPGEQVERA